ncbi:hypothetical protein [Nocardia sp. NPDC049149]|uniref:hypothetical protein n=1 Tax=Nocardia sp. NPDC049149 TaxID=3364315 RepID=UPI00372262DC
MLEQQLPHRVTRFARAVGVLLLLAGIVAMHAAVFARPDHEHSSRLPATAHGTAAAQHGSPGQPGAVGRHSIGAPDATATAAGHGLGQPLAHDATPPMAMSALGSMFPMPDHGAGGADCAGGGCAGAHGGMHGCVFILSTIALLFGLVLLYRMALDRPGTGLARPRSLRRRRERAPPWTVLSLAELSILRI